MKSKHVYLLITVALLLIPIILSASIRSTTAYLPQVDGVAENAIKSQLRAQIEPQVRQGMPFASPQAINQEVNVQIDDAIQADPETFYNTVDALASQYRSAFQDDNGQTYLVALDPYYFFRFVRNILDHGHPGEYLSEDGTPMTNFINAPTEKSVQLQGDQFHVQFAVFWHKFLNIFRDVPLSTSFFYIPVIIMSIAAIPAFFLGRKLGGNLAGVTAAIIIVTHPLLISRTIGGFSDTDSYNILFPLLTMWLLLETFDKEKLWQKLSLAAGAGLSLALFAYAWVGWWYLFYIIAAGFVVYGVLYGARSLVLEKKKIQSLLDIKENKELIDSISTGFVFLVCTIFFASILISFSGVYNGLQFAFEAEGGLKNAADATFWPNIATTIAELNPSSFTAIISQSGVNDFSRALFFAACIGIILCFFHGFALNKPLKKINIAKPAFLFVWFVLTIYINLIGVRFSILYIPVFALALGSFIGISYRLIRHRIKDTTMQHIITGIFVVIVLMVTVPYVNAGNQVAINTYPSVSDDYYNLLVEIKNNSEPSAIISSWWDFGHQFITIAQRGATADGGSQNGPQSVWLAKALVAQNPLEFNGISRMLNCDSNGGYQKIFDAEKDVIRAVNITRQLHVVEREEAQTILQNQNYTNEQVADILESTHCMPEVESFWIASADMIGKAGVWGHFGTWDFKRAKAWNLRTSTEFVPYVEETFGYTTQQAITLQQELKTYTQPQGNAWISPYPTYKTQKMSCQTQNQTVVCPINTQLSQTLGIAQARFNTTSPQNITLTVVENGQQGFIGVGKIVYVTNGTMQTIKEQEANPIGAVIEEANGQYNILLADNPLLLSSFTRMFFYNGVGMEDVIEPFSNSRTVTGNQFIVYKRKTGG